MLARIVLMALVVALRAGAEPVPVRHLEGPSRGFVLLTDDDGRTLAHGELEQWMRGDTVMSRLLFEFTDGSVYDELVRFSQRRVFRVESYRLVQRGPSFTETSDVSFDRTGRYRVRRREGDEPEEEKAGRVELPADVMNGMTSVTCKNLMPGGSTTVHVVAFRPDPLVMELHVGSEGADEFRAGGLVRSATRFVVQPRVTGLTGAFATVTGQQPSALRMWIVRGRAPSLVRFVGPLYADGPTWRVQPTGPEWGR